MIGLLAVATVFVYFNTKRLQSEVKQGEVRLENSKKQTAECEQKLKIKPFDAVGRTLYEVTNGEINTTINNDSGIEDGQYIL